MKTINLKSYFDERGSLAENTFEEIVTSSKHFFISKSKPGVVRGNHYHNHKIEWFVIVKGKGKVVVEDLESKEREEVVIDEEDNLAVKMEVKKAHAVKNIGDNEMILLAFVNETLDKENPDTFPHEVI